VKTTTKIEKKKKNQNYKDQDSKSNKET